MEPTTSTLRIRYRPSVLGDIWSLYRTTDDHLEATSFTDEADARQWAADLGYEVVGGLG